MFRLHRVLSILLLFLSFAVITPLQAQKKIFQMVTDEISSQVNPIFQDNALVGYLVFSQLEEAKADSFNYKLTILDENLNDIGVVNFTEEKLYLKGVVLEQDVLCISYLKTNIIHRQFKSKREFHNISSKAKSSLLVQFLNLNGKIVNTSDVPLEVKADKEPIFYYDFYIAKAKLKHDILLKNIPQTGFTLLYGDDSKNKLLFYNTSGVQTGQKTLSSDCLAFSLLTAKNEIFLLAKRTDKMNEGGYELLGFNGLDTTAYPVYKLKDKQGNSLKPFAFDHDPVSGKPFVAGQIIDPLKGNANWCGRDLRKGPYSGVFALDIEDLKNKKVTEKFSYWGDGSKDFINKRGYHSESRSYVRYKSAFRDFNGNTFYIGSGIRKRPKWGAIIPSVIFAPLIIVPAFVLPTAGTHQYKATDAIVLKQDAKNRLSFDNVIPANHTRLYNARAIYLGNYDKKNFYNIINFDAKSNFIVLDDVKDIIFYNVNKRKIVRTIPHKDGQLRTSIYPAKEGHVMITGYNKKEKYLSVSIEAL